MVFWVLSYELSALVLLNDAENQEKVQIFCSLYSKHDCDNRNAVYLSCFKDTSIVKRLTGIVIFTKSLNFTIFSRYLSYNFPITKFFIQILRWKPFSSPLDLAGPSESQGINVNSFQHCAVLTASDKHLKILLGCDFFLLIVNYGSFQMYKKHKCYHEMFF